MKSVERPEIHARNVAIFVACFALALASIELAAKAWLSNEAAPKLVDRKPNVKDFSSDLTSLAAPQGDRAFMMLMGNSHTYGLPGLEKGMPLRPETSATLIDELARRVDTTGAQGPTEFCRLAYPNFLPFEYLTTIGYLEYRGYQPKVIVMGWSFGNFTRNRDLRYTIYSLYRDEEFAQWMTDRLAKESRTDAVPVAAAVAGERRKADNELQAEKMLSHADKLDTQTVDALSEYVTLLGGSATLRARLYKKIVNSLQSAVVQNVEGYEKSVVASDLEFNLHCMRLLLEWLKEQNVQVLVYYAPQRSDLPAFTDYDDQEVVLRELSDFARNLGFTVVDARNVVPNEYWGWVDNYPDRAHFTEPGHALLAQFLFEAGQRAGTWGVLGDLARAPAAGASPNQTPTTVQRATP